MATDFIDEKNSKAKLTFLSDGYTLFLMKSNYSPGVIFVHG
jgi:hypothetical protein